MEGDEIRPAIRGVIYLLHFDRKFHHSQHYLGWAKGVDAAARMRTHILGKRGAKIVKGAIDAGIGFDLALLIPDATRDFERWLKNQKMANRFCPMCSGDRRRAVPRAPNAMIITPGHPLAFSYRVGQ